jgi:DNA transposition AAA+ family ATPase
MTNDQLDMMATSLEAYIKDKGISQNEAAKKIGISAPYITYALKRNWDAVPTGGKKARFNAAIARRIMKHLGIDTVIWEIDNYMITTNILIEAKKYQEHRIVDGSKGSGKTFAATQFAKKAPIETFLLTCSEDMNPKAFMVDLARLVGSDTTGDRRKIRMGIGEKIKRMTSPLIIIDEGENLKPATYGSIKALYDDIKDYCGIVLIGANNYLDNLRKKAGAGKGCFPQIYSRFSAEPGLLSDMTKEDLILACEANGITDKETINSLHKRCTDFRELDTTIKGILRDKKL